MGSLFVNAEGRLRAGWRIVLFGALLLVLQAALAFAVWALADGRGGANPLVDEAALGLLIGAAVGLLSTTLAVYLARRWFDRRSFASLGLAFGPAWAADVAAGLVLALLLQGLIFAVELAAGWIVVDAPIRQRPGDALRGLFLYGLAFLLVGWTEELLTRGYLLQNLREGMGTTWAVALTSLAFGALHLANPNASPVAALGVACAGLLFAVAYLSTRSLWLPIALHAGWNIAEGPIFGFPVSGLEAGGLVNPRPVGPELVTGGAFGPEAGLVSIVADVVGLGLVWRYARWRARRFGDTPSVT